jgi:hypothetical protein
LLILANLICWVAVVSKRTMLSAFVFSNRFSSRKWLYQDLFGFLHFH